MFFLLIRADQKRVRVSLGSSRTRSPFLSLCAPLKLDLGASTLVLAQFATGS